LNTTSISPDAKAAFAAALSVDPKSPAANFYTGLVAWRSDRKDEALEIWTRAYNALDRNPDGQSLIATRAGDVMSTLDRGPSDNGAGAMQAGSGDQRAMISSMIDTRMARLGANPNDVALRLSVVRVLIASGRREEARRTLLAGAQRTDNTPFTIALYTVAAQGLVAAQSPSAPTVTER
jgi:cytochrome c-type biogenesis protein CcmH